MHLEMAKKNLTGTYPTPPGPYWTLPISPETLLDLGQAADVLTFVALVRIISVLLIFLHKIKNESLRVTG